MEIDWGESMPFQKHDRISHPLFGNGTVESYDSSIDGFLVVFDNGWTSPVEKEDMTLLCPLFEMEPGYGCLSNCGGCPCP